MRSISQTFNELAQKGEGALIPYLTVGYPNIKKTPRLLAALIEGGADIIELGIPFSDPIADGPIIQAATSRSLASGVRPLDALDIARTASRKYDVPMVLMTYFNLIFRVGLSKFVRLAVNSGISGIIVPDMPVEEAQDYKKECVSAGIDTIFLASPSTEPDRLKQILAQTSGYLYLISLYGVTGTRSKITDSALRLIRQYNEMITGSVPLAVGFGISNPDHVRQMIRAGADGAIVGSALIEIISENPRNLARATEKLKKVTKAMKKATIKAKP